MISNHIVMHEGKKGEERKLSSLHSMQSNQTIRPNYDKLMEVGKDFLHKRNFITSSQSPEIAISPASRQQWAINSGLLYSEIEVMLNSYSQRSLKDHH